MTKVAFYITSTGWGGLEMNHLKLALALMRSGVEISIYTPISTKIYEKALERNLPVITIRKPKKHMDIRNAYRISSLLRKNNDNIVYLSDNKDIEIIALCKKLFYPDIKLIYQQQMQLGISKKDIIHRIRYQSINYWISPLNFLKQQVLEKTTIPEEKIRIIPLGVDTGRFGKRKYSKEEARNKSNIKTTGLLFGIIGRIEPKKGQDFLIRALIELRKRHIDAELLIFGSSTINDEKIKNYYKELKLLVKENDLENACHFMDHNPDLSVAQF